MRRNNSIFYLITAVAVGFVLFFAFAIPKRNTTLTNKPPIYRDLNYEQNLTKSTRLVSPKPAASPQAMQVYDKQKTDRIYNELNKLKEFNKLGVLVTGNSALITYNPDNLKKNVKATKDSIIKRVKKIDASIKHVVVSDSAEIGARLSKLAKDIVNNKPSKEISNEFNQIIKRAAPVSK